MADSARLIHALRAQLEDLRRHHALVAERRERLGRAYGRLRSVYEGRAAAELDQRWQRTERHLDDHEEGVRALSTTLAERLRALEAADRPEGHFGDGRAR